MIVLARLASAPTVAVERLDGFQFPALVVAVLFSRRLWKMMTQTHPSTNWAPGVCFGAARAVGYKLAQDVLSILLGRRRACYYGRQRWRRGPASLGVALLRYGRRAPAAAWRWSTPAARARRCSLATPRPRALAPPARARARSRARATPVASPIVVTRAVCSAVHARALTSHTRLTPFGSCRTDRVSLRSDHRCCKLAQKAQLYAAAQKVPSTRALAAVRH